MNQGTYHVKVSKTITLREFHRLRMLEDWQLYAEGYDPIEISLLSNEVPRLDFQSEGKPLIATSGF
jgi:hypothetical protein